MPLGKQAGALTPCTRKPDTHGFHPTGEECPYCEPPPVDEDTLPLEWRWWQYEFLD